MIDKVQRTKAKLSWRIFGIGLTKAENHLADKLDEVIAKINELEKKSK